MGLRGLLIRGRAKAVARPTTVSKRLARCIQVPKRFSLHHLQRASCSGTVDGSAARKLQL